MSENDNSDSDSKVATPRTPRPRAPRAAKAAVKKVPASDVEQAPKTTGGDPPAPVRERAESRNDDQPRHEASAQPRESNEAPPPREPRGDAQPRHDQRAALSDDGNRQRASNAHSTADNGSQDSVRQDGGDGHQSERSGQSADPGQPGQADAGGEHRHQGDQPAGNQGGQNRPNNPNTPNNPNQAGRNDRNNRRNRNNRNNRNNPQNRDRDRDYDEDGDDSRSGGGDGPLIDMNELKRKSAAELFTMAETLGVQEGAARARKQDIVFLILKAHARSGGGIYSEGVLEILQDGFGFLRGFDASLPGRARRHLRVALADSALQPAHR